MDRSILHQTWDSAGGEKKLLEDILPRYGFPTMIGSDSGFACVSQVSLNLGTILRNNWKLHCAYRPQSSG